MTVVATDSVPPRAAAATLGERHWRVAAIALLSVRFIQGFIYWGGGSRRFTYGPEKLNPDAPTWMANKFQSAMPGALLGTDHLIAFLLHHFWLLYPAVILFSGAELIAGAALMAGLLTRLAAPPIHSTMCCSSAVPAWPTAPGSAGSPAAYRCRSRTRRFAISGSRCWPGFWPSTSEPTAIIEARSSRRSTAGRSALRGTTLRSATALCCRMAA